MSPLRIALNATAAVTGGGVTYWLNLLPALAALDRPHEYLLLVAEQQNRIQAAAGARFQIERINFGRAATLRRVVWEQTRLPAILAARGIDVLLAPADVAPLRARCAVVMAVRNPSPYWGTASGALRERLHRALLRKLTRASAKRARIVYFVSEDSRRRMTPLLGLPEGKTRVVYHGLGPAFSAPLDRPGASGKRYVLCVSAMYVHKDFETLLRAFATLRKARAEGTDLGLVIAGAVVDRPYFERLERLSTELGVAECVSFRGEVPYADLPGLYRGAELFVLPSRAETFGHPLVEAMASGVATVATDLEVTREICGGAISYFTAGDDRELAERMRDLLSNESLRSERSAAGIRRASSFSWTRSARETLGLLEEAAGYERDSVR